MRHRWTPLFKLLLCLPIACYAQDSRYPPKNQLIPGPACLASRGLGGAASCGESTHVEWLNDVTHWRDERRIRIGYDGSRYNSSTPRWIQSSFIQPQMMVQDRYFYDPVSRRYTVDRYLDDLDKRYGGIDSVLIWPTYPNMGVDNRNQHDMIRSMPGGVAGVKQMIADFHRRGVRVLFPMMMWDQGTRDPGKSWPKAIAELMKELDADGINGDTQDGVPLAFSLAADRVGHPLVFEPEGSPSDEALAWNLMGWGQYGGQFDFVPGVDRFRWLDARHMVHISDRWNRSKTNDLQYAFFNGEGWESWENIWGIWNGITPRDAEAARRVATMERWMYKYLTYRFWEPFFPMRSYGIFASGWELEPRDRVWTIVNRNEYDVDGPQMAVQHWVDGMQYFDLYHGVELTPQREGRMDVLSFSIEAHGYGAVLALPLGTPESLAGLLSKMKTMTSRPLASYSDEWKVLPQKIVDIPATKKLSSAPDGMVKIAGGPYLFRVQGIEIEGSNDIGVDVQCPWEDSARRYHEHPMELKSFFIDKYPVTNAQFKGFLDATKYHPADDLNFLRDWSKGTYPEGWANKPVTWVSQQDSRAYAVWAGKRLPHEWEWQFAAQGTDGRAYPWGNEWNPSAVPVPDKGRTMRGPDEVTAHPEGGSSFGVMDLVGNIWQWTDEYLDEHTRAGILRGGSYYQPQGSMWYFPQAYRNDQHGKLLLMSPGYDRSATVGFRCVSDAE
jgi:gamma-glutamyl hercynylcysteine S-oxide synthase